MGGVLFKVTTTPYKPKPSKSFVEKVTQLAPKLFNGLPSPRMKASSADRELGSILAGTSFLKARRMLLDRGYGIKLFVANKGELMTLGDFSDVRDELCYYVNVFDPCWIDGPTENTMITGFAKWITSENQIRRDDLCVFDFGQLLFDYNSMGVMNNEGDIDPVPDLVAYAKKDG